MLHTEDVEQKFGNTDNGNGRFIELYVRKNRDGKLGKVSYEYFGDYIDFVEKEWINGVTTTVIQDDLKATTFLDDIEDDSLPF
jgi:hypothetical protein